MLARAGIARDTLDLGCGSYGGHFRATALVPLALLVHLVVDLEANPCLAGVPRFVGQELVDPFHGDFNIGWCSIARFWVPGTDRRSTPS